MDELARALGDSLGSTDSSDESLGSTVGDAPNQRVVELDEHRVGPELPNALPMGWIECKPSLKTDAGKSIGEIREITEELAEGVIARDEVANFSDLVGSVELRGFPVHRWFSYKEAFSPRLPGVIAARLGVGESGTVVDPFAGVGTTSLGLQRDRTVNRVIGVEYSPLARFVGATKIRWAELSAGSVSRNIDRLRDFPVDKRIEVPPLSSLANPEIFTPTALATLLSCIETVRSDKNLSKLERDFFLLGIAATIEDCSGVLKDGRALRILRDRTRRRKSLSPNSGRLDDGSVRSVIVNQWNAMLEDLVTLQPARAQVRHRRDLHLRGDARELQSLTSQGIRGRVLEQGSVGLFVYSPPYLNCIDYSEVYKLELWMLGHVANQHEFKSLRLGTLRSHPSVAFPARNYLESAPKEIVSLIDKTAKVLEEQLPRPGLGRMTKNYFDDMYKVFVEQLALLEPGGSFACVVANSTFSRRESSETGKIESWRLPLLTDVILCRLAESAGFERCEIWNSRSLRARNVQHGQSRESVVVARKPKR